MDHVGHPTDSSRGRKSKIKVLADSVSDKDLLSGVQTVPFLPCPQMGETELTEISSFSCKYTESPNGGSTVNTSSRPNYPQRLHVHIRKCWRLGFLDTN